MTISSKDNTKEHQALVDDLLFAFGSRRDTRIWPRVVGVARCFDSNNVVRYGIEGETDLQGISLIEGLGLYLGVEVKTGKAVLSRPQERWRDMVIAFGGIHIVARSVEQAIADYEAWIYRVVSSIGRA